MLHYGLQLMEEVEETIELWGRDLHHWADASGNSNLKTGSSLNDFGWLAAAYPAPNAETEDLTMGFRIALDRLDRSVKARQTKMKPGANLSASDKKRASDKRRKRNKQAKEGLLCCPGASVASTSMWDRSILDEAVPLKQPAGSAGSTGGSSWDKLTILLVPGLFTKWYPAYFKTLEANLVAMGVKCVRSVVDTDQAVNANAKIVAEEVRA